MRRGLHPLAAQYADALVALAAHQGIKVAVTEGFRPRYRQARLYAQGRTRPGAVVTNAPPGRSVHETGLAFDVRIVGGRPYDSALLARVGEIGEALGMRWGGRFTGLVDMPHFEVPL